jgi:hypothetical protein
MDGERPRRGLLFAWAEGGREGERIVDEPEDSRVMERRCSEKEARPSLIKSLTTLMEVLFSLTVMVDLEPFDELEDRRSSKLSFDGLPLW